MVERGLKGPIGRWSVAFAATTAGFAFWALLNASPVHFQLIGGQPDGGWPKSWAESLLLMPAFVGGLVAMMVPCVLQMSLVFTAVTAGLSTASAEGLTGKRPGAGVLSQTGQFLLGYVAFYSSLGVVLGGLGQGLAMQGDMLLAILRTIGGVLMAGLGLHLVGLLKLPVASFCRGPVGFLLGVEPRGRFGATRAGIAFAIYCAGCCGPFIFAVLAAAAASGSATFSALFLFVFSLGLAIPFFMIAVSRDLASRYLEASAKRLATISLISGTFLIVFGVMMVLG